MMYHRKQNVWHLKIYISSRNKSRTTHYKMGLMLLCNSYYIPENGAVTWKIEVLISKNMYFSTANYIKYIDFQMK